MAPSLVDQYYFQERSGAASGSGLASYADFASFAFGRSPGPVRKPWPQHGSAPERDGSMLRVQMLLQQVAY